MKKILIAIVVLLIVFDLSYFSRYVNRFETWLLKNNCLKSVSFYNSLSGNDSTCVQYYKPAELNDTTVLLMHGGGNDALYPSIGLTKLLLSKGYNVISYDIEGHGKNSSSFFHEDSVLKSLITFVEQNNEIIINKKVYVVGYSLGAAVMLHSLSILDDRFEAVVAVSVPIKLNIETSVRKEFLSFMKRSLFSNIKHYGVYGILPAVSGFKRKAYPIRIQNNYERNEKIWKNYIQFFAKSFEKMNLSQSVTLIKTPVLFIGGTNDPIAKPRDIERLDSLTPNSEFELIDGETHLTTYMSDECENCIIDWIKKH